MAEAAAAIAELKRKQEMARMEAAKAEQKQRAAEQAAREAQRQAEDAAKEERERTARETATKAAQEEQATAQSEAENQIADQQGFPWGLAQRSVPPNGLRCRHRRGLLRVDGHSGKARRKLIETATKQNPETAPVINLLIEEYNVAYHHAVATMTVWNGSAQSYSARPFSCANGKDVMMIRKFEATILENLQ